MSNADKAASGGVAAPGRVTITLTLDESRTPCVVGVLIMTAQREALEAAFTGPPR